MDSLLTMNERGGEGLLTLFALPPSASDNIMQNMGICSLLQGNNNNSNNNNNNHQKDNAKASHTSDTNSNSNSVLQHTSSSIINSSSNSSSRRMGESAGSGLLDTHFNVLSADKSETLSIPPELIEPTAGSRNYVAKNHNTSAPTFSFYLCKMYTSNSTCTHGALCDFIHSRHMLTEAPLDERRVKVIRVHWSTPVPSLQEALYERHEPGFVFHINNSNSNNNSNHNNNNNSNNSTVNIPRRLASEHVYKTKGSEDAQRSGSMKLLRLCKHYEREKCARGRMCNFIHRVHLTPSQSSLHTAAARNAHRGHTAGVPHTMTGTFTQSQQRPAVISFPNPNGNRLIIPPPSFQLPQQQQQQQPQSHHQQQSQQQQQQQSSPMFAQPRGYSFGPIYTSQQTSYVNNPSAAGSSTSSLPSLPMQSRTTYYPSHQQRQHDPQQHVISDVQRQSMLSISTPPDCFLSPLLFTFM
ncbi:uncharacterized protein TM35_000222490 [Trypanosoma theileri]|uniref:C3H1-type domain-containing protein n=1 Tax=Trypanosoma theileri TaxID=67003 RepID=A0A1X0NTL5_9TRYP|nr:uncharacterized protein TM35_000222490 [Trypanosoma theileri]ORC87450.1 hypothetical protein TM35_000222490 [Trypanosoma theileri]